MLENAVRAENKRIREEGRLQGLVEARAEAIAQAVAEGKLENAFGYNLKVARMMLQNGEPPSKIERYTGISEEALLSVQTKHETV